MQLAENEKVPPFGETLSLVETLLTTWNQIKRELIVASEIYQSMRITYLIES